MIGEHKAETIARRLGVSIDRVHNRMARLGLSRRVEGIYSANELATVLGLEGNWIRRFLLESGLLPSTRIAGRGRFGVTQIKDQDLVAFLRASPHLIDRDRIDVAYRQYVDERWITTVEAFRRGASHPVELDHAFHAGTVDEVRKRGVRWVIPESILPRLVAGRRRWLSDTEHRRQVRVYDRHAIRDAQTGRRKLASLRRAS
jgi:translation initiation factor IF-1